MVFSAFNFAKLFLTLANRVIKYMSDKNLMKAGEEKALNDLLEKTNAEIHRGLMARRDAERVRESEDPFAD